MEERPDYNTWSQDGLIKRIEELELELKNKSRSLSSPAKKSWKKPRTERQFDPSKYSTRLIALKLAYLGKRYNGLEHHSGHVTPLPTIEEELWKALNKARLIFPRDSHPLQPGELSWEGCEYSKCGRTDKGVSAFGQVIGIRVRSNRPLRKRKENAISSVDGFQEHDDFYNTFSCENGLELAALSISPSRGASPASPSGPGEISLEDSDNEGSLDFDPIADEIQYPSVLNRVLPPDIRILAWCPSPPLNFSARFHCRERRYKYFFTQPAFAPIPHGLEPTAPPGTDEQIKDGWLNIDAMREAAKAFIGVNDFRNFCKVDPSKQIENFERHIFHADITEVEDCTSSLSYLNGKNFLPAVSAGSSERWSNNPKVYTFNLHGSAFLWHQVRHMVAILFLVGQGLEKPSIVSELLNVKKNPRRPMYEMASDTPLVLWDCIFPREDDPERKDIMQWQYIGDSPEFGHAKYGTGGLVDELWKVWRERKIDEILAGSLLNVVASQGIDVTHLRAGIERKGGKSQKVFDGGDVPRLQGKYLAVMKKEQRESVEVINEKYAVRKGFHSAEDMKDQGIRGRRKSSEEIAST